MQIGEAGATRPSRFYRDFEGIPRYRPKMSETLTDREILSYLLSITETERGMDMKGTIRARGNCPECQGSFEQIKKLGFICPKCKIIPTRFFIDLFYEKNRIKIYSDKTGQVLDSYQRALNLLSSVNTELNEHSFDPSKYVRSELEHFLISNLLDRFLSFKLNSIAPSYQKDYKRIVYIAKDYFKTKDVREIRKIDLLNYKDHIERNYKLAGKSAKNVLDLVKTFLRYCKNDLEVIDNVPAFPEIEIQEHSFKWLSQEDQVTLYDRIPEEDKPIIAFLMLHGCRPSEARALKCKNIDLKTQTVTISATFSGRVYREKRKGRRSRAVTIPIHPEMLDYITERVRGNLPEAFVFTNKRGLHYSENKLKRIWDAAREKNGIGKEIRLYDATRHSFASQLVNAGTSLFKVSKLLGHSSIKMTEKYAHQNIESLKSDLHKLSLKRKSPVPELSLSLKRGKN